MDDRAAREAFGAPFDARPHFARVRSDLMDLLGTLTPSDWERPSAAAPWSVRDVVAHLLGDDVGRISRSRDHHVVSLPRPGEDLPQFIHRINEEWVTATARISPALLVDLLRTTTPQVMSFWQQVDLDAFGEAVSWAGPGAAPVWLDCARDFTEDWVHQQQIRQAVGRVPPSAPEIVHAVLETFLRAVPYTLNRSAPGPADGASLTVQVPGAAGGTWSWRRADSGWIWGRPGGAPATSITVNADDLWRVCVRMIEPFEASARAEVHGDTALAEAALRLVSIVR